MYYTSKFATNKYTKIEPMKLEPYCIGIECCRCDKQQSIIDGIVVLSDVAKFF